MRWWVLAEFLSEAELLIAVQELRSRGFRRLDAHTPFPVLGLSEALDLKPSRVSWIALLAGFGGAVTGYGVQWFCNAVDWPLNVGGRPPHSALAFVPITFETAVLFSCSAIFFSLLAMFGLPRVTHPVFNLEAFRTASIDCFWVSLATEEEETRTRATNALRELGARTVSVVAEGV